MWLVLDSGDREALDTDMVLGRAPTPQDSSERAVTIADPTRSLSRTHVRVGPEGEGVWVQDAFSANGTSARLPDGSHFDLERGTRVHLPIGAVLIMGERSLTIAAEGRGRH